MDDNMLSMTTDRNTQMTDPVQDDDAAFEPRPLLDTNEIATINAARTVLKKLAYRANNASLDCGPPRRLEFAFGRVAESADLAEHALARALVNMNIWAGEGLTEAQLHNLPEGDDGV